MDWHTANGEQLPKVVLELSGKRDGWTPQGWHDRLLQMATRCGEDHPERAAELRQAARLMEHGAEGRT